MRFYADAARAPRRSAALRGRASTGRARTGGAVGPARASSGSIVVVCDFLVPAVNLPRAAVPGGALHPQRRSRDLAAARRDRRNPWRAPLLTAAVAPDAALRAAHARALRRRPRRLRRRRDTFTRLYPGRARQAGPRRPHRRRHRLLRTRRGRRRARAASSSPARWTGCRTKTRCCIFCRDILPLIRAEEPDVTLSIVGRAPTPAVAALADDPASRSPAASTTSGRTSRDAAVYVVPLRIGGGTRLKIFEAMAMGKAVVSTTVGAEGLPVTTDATSLHRRRPATRSPTPSFVCCATRHGAGASRPRRAARGRALRLVGGRRADLEQALTTVAGAAAGPSLSPRMERRAIEPAGTALGNIGRNQG